MSTYVYAVMCQKEPDGRWSAFIPELPGCATWGFTKEEAIENLKVEAQAFLDVLAKDELLPAQAPGAKYFDQKDVLALSL